MPIRPYKPTVSTAVHSFGESGFHQRLGNGTRTRLDSGWTTPSSPQMLSHTYDQLWHLYWQWLSHAQVVITNWNTGPFHMLMIFIMWNSFIIWSANITVIFPVVRGHSWLYIKNELHWISFSLLKQVVQSPHRICQTSIWFEYSFFFARNIIWWAQEILFFQFSPKLMLLSFFNDSSQMTFCCWRQQWSGQLKSSHLLNYSRSSRRQNITTMEYQE